MANDQQQLTRDGQAVQQSDFNAVFREAALADDAVLAELLRLAPYGNGSNPVARAIIPFAVSGAFGLGPTVGPSAFDGSVRVMPFRAVLGTRSSIAGSSALATWTDIRSRVYAVADTTSQLGHAQAFNPNVGSTPRWDVVYCRFDVDQNGPTVNRNVRAPGSLATDPPVSTPVVVNLTQTLTIGVAAGTAAASPVFPAIPTDNPSAGTFYIALAAVRIPPGFGSTSFVTQEQICMLAPCVPLSAAFGAVTSGVPSGLSSGISVAIQQQWGASGVRPSSMVPCTKNGAVRMRFPIDATTASPLIADGGVLDNSIDWRKRDFTVRCSTKVGATQFAWQLGATSGALPQAGASTVASTQDGQSFLDDSAAVLEVASRNAGVVFFANNAVMSAIAAGSNAIGLYVDLSNGTLKVFYAGTPGVPLFFTLEASAPFDNA